MTKELFENARIGDLFIAEDGAEYRYCGRVINMTNYTHILQCWSDVVPTTVWCNDRGVSNKCAVRITHRRDPFPFLSEVPPEYYYEMLERAKKMQEQNRYLPLDMGIEQAEKEWLIEMNYAHGYRTWESPIKRLFRILCSTWNKKKCNFICTCQRK